MYVCNVHTYVCTYIDIRTYAYIHTYIPLQDLLLLLRAYPLRQEHKKLPAVLLQMCPHGDDAHSLMSTS